MYSDQVHVGAVTEDTDYSIGRLHSNLDTSLADSGPSIGVIAFKSRKIADRVHKKFFFSKYFVEIFALCTVSPTASIDADEF